jgi:hypothetical protein
MDVIKCVYKIIGLPLSVHYVDHGDISDYVPLIRHDVIDLSFSHSIRALPSPFPLRLLLEERVHREEPLLFEKVDENLPPMISNSKSMGSY